MKHAYVSFFVVFVSMVAVLHAGSSSAERLAPEDSQAPAAAEASAAAGSGVVEAIHSRPGNSDALDAAADHLIGNQVVSRDGRTIAMLAGAMFSMTPQSGHGTRPVYDIQVRMRDGSMQNFVQDSANGLRVGDSVRPDGGRVYRS